MAKVQGITEINLDGVLYKIARSDTMTGDKILHQIVDSTQAIIESVFEDEDSESELVDLETVDAADLEDDEEVPEGMVKCLAPDDGYDNYCHPNGCKECNYNNR